MTVKAFVLAAVLTVVAFTGATAQETPRMGGVLKVATIGEPPTLDMPSSTATQVYEIMWHVNESLFAYDRTWTPAPLLAESSTLGERGLRLTIALRKGVKFHNGKEMTAADVVPSLQRWGKVASVGKVLWRDVESIEARDPYTVVVHLKKPSGSFLYGLAEPHSSIYPKESLDAAGDGQLKEFIGTGPYRFGERDKDKARRLMKEAGYTGQPVRWVSTREYEFMYKNALVAKQQMEAVGFVVDLQVVDWATLNHRTEKPELWDVFSTGFVFAADPALHFTLDVARRDLRGDFRTAPRMYFWNAWLAR